MNALGDGDAPRLAVLECHGDGVIIGRDDWSIAIVAFALIVNNFDGGARSGGWNHCMRMLLVSRSVKDAQGCRRKGRKLIGEMKGDGGKVTENSFMSTLCCAFHTGFLPGKHYVAPSNKEHDSLISELFYRKNTSFAYVICEHALTPKPPCGTV